VLDIVIGVVLIDNIEFKFAGMLFGGVCAISIYKGLGLVFIEVLRAGYFIIVSSFFYIYFNSSYSYLFCFLIFIRLF